MSTAPELVDDVPLSEAFPLGADASVWVSLSRPEAPPAFELARRVGRLRRRLRRFFRGAK